MADREHLEKLKQGVKEWHKFRTNHQDIVPDFRKADLTEIHLESAYLSDAHFEEADLMKAHFEGANLRNAHLEEADLESAYFEKAYLRKAHLEGADLREAHLEGADLREAHLEKANLTGVTFDSTTNLSDVIFSNKKYGSALLADIHWGDTNLAVIDWAHMKIVGDELKARNCKKADGSKKTKVERYKEYAVALRTNRQLAVVLRNQGLNEEADHFAYRAQLLKRSLLLQQALLPNVQLWQRLLKFIGYMFSLLLDILAGYGYHPGQTAFIYLLIIGGFAGAYHFWGGLSLFPPDAFIYSLTSFHGRGFFPGLQTNHSSLHDPLIMLAALEAVVGLFIEASFIATFTQRFFGR